MIIPVIHTEKSLQINDLTRFDASKSILVKGSTNAITSVKIKPGLDGTGVEVFNSNPKNWFLDWAFTDYAFDVDADGANEVSFKMGSTEYKTTVGNGTYSLANLLTAIKTAVETLVPTVTLSFEVDEKNRVSFIPSLPLEFQPNKTPNDLMKHIGFTKPGLEGNPVEYGLRKVILTIECAAVPGPGVADSAETFSFIQVYTPEGDALFSEDADLVSEEPDIMKWLPAGRSSFMDLHRKSQKLILDFMDRQGYRDDNGDKITKFAFVDNSDVRLWSYYQVLRLFFMGAQNAKDDVFKDKAKYYEKLEIASRDRAILSLDLDGDKEPDVVNVGIREGRIFLR